VRENVLITSCLSWQFFW